jgi:hypothetical protein
MAQFAKEIAFLLGERGKGVKFALTIIRATCSGSGSWFFKIYCGKG